MSFLNILTIASGVLLIIFFKGPNAVWGGATAGAIIGVIVGFFMGSWLDGLRWGFFIGTSIGVVAELCGILSNRLKRRI